MQQKVFIVSEVTTSGSERIIAVRLTEKAARAIAKQKGGRRVTRFYADKDEFLKEQERSTQTYINQP